MENFDWFDFVRKPEVEQFFDISTRKLCNGKCAWELFIKWRSEDENFSFFRAENCRNSDVSKRKTSDYLKKIVRNKWGEK